jgi:Bacterial membrane protein YfhO
MNLSTPARKFFAEQRFAARMIRTESFRAAVVLIGILHVAFFPCIWGDRSLLASAKDVLSIMPNGAWAGPPSAFVISRSPDNGGGGVFGEPNLPLLRYQYFHERVVPLWDPYQGYGAPLAANQQSQPFYPLTMMLLLHIGPRTYNWFLLARLFMAGIASYLYLRLFVSFWPAITGGITSMLAGYYLLFLTMPQLSVEVLIPASLLAPEYLLRKRAYWPVAGFATMLLFVFLGGMPESALLLFTLLYTYILFRIVSDGDLRSSWLTMTARVTAGTVAGLALAAFFLLPFSELMHRSFDIHQPHNVGGRIIGMYSDAFGSSIFTYIFPLLHGPPATEIAGARNYVGLVSFLFVVVAVMALFSRRRGSDASLQAISWFFFGAAVLIELKRFGFPGIESLGSLPFYRLVNFPKYEEAPLSICMSILGAIGVERLLRREISVRAQTIALMAAILLIPTALFFSRHSLNHEISHSYLSRRFPVTALGIPTILMIGMGFVLVFSWKRKIAAGLDVRLAVGLAALVSAEMCMNFIAPTHFWFNKLARMAHNPFAGAPYIDVIKKQPGNYRFFARDGLLYPNWAAAFQVYDVRYLDALYEKKYLRFIQNFFQDQKNVSYQYDLGDRFNGTGPYNSTTPLVRRLFQLSSVSQIGSIRAFTVPNRMIDEALEQNKGHLIPGKEAAIARREFILGDQARDALGEHSPYERLPYRIHVGNAPQEIFGFSYGMDPVVFDKASTDGVEFIVETKDSSGRIAKQFSQYIDPKHDAHVRRWMDGQIDVSVYRGQTIDLLFTTTPGPKGDNTSDWAAWSNFHFLGQDPATLGQAPPFKLIYNAEAKIYRYDDVLPRAAVYHRAELARDENEVLKKLADPSMDVFQTVILDDSALNVEQRARVAEINRDAPARVQAASIQSYESQDVQIQASLDRAGILVLNDAGYPGWLAQIDGQPAKWISANYMFRAVLVPPGKHAVRFLYQPKSFRQGATVSGLAMACLLVVGFIHKHQMPAEPGTG